jgi:hypothetical protein
MKLYDDRFAVWKALDLAKETKQKDLTDDQAKLLKSFDQWLDQHCKPRELFSWEKPR